MQFCERRIIATPHVHIAHVREKNMPPAGSGELISRKLRSPSHSALSNHPFHPYPPPDLFTPHPHPMNQTACSYEWEFVQPMTIMLASITNSLNIFLGVDMYTELFLSLAFTLNCTIAIADLRFTVIFGSKLHFACFPPLVIFCRWAHPVQARESGAGTPPFR